MSVHAAELHRQTEPTGAERESGRAMPFVLGIVGDSGSGKNTVADAVRLLIGPRRVTDVHLDDYHRYTRAERLDRNLTALNPAVHDLDLMREHLQLLRSGRSVRIRSYEHANGTFGPVRTVEPRDVVIVRGLLGFPTDEHRAAYDLAAFLEPEPDLLFRWKLRRDVRSRGYTQAEVLKNIAQHLLDSKEFVLPQARRADLVVHYLLPDPEAPDTDVRVRLHLRRTAAEALTNAISSLDRFGQAAHVERQEDGVILELTPDVDRRELDGWATERFPTYSSTEIGVTEDDQGAPQFLPPLAFVEVLIARLTQKLRRVENVPV